MIQTPPRLSAMRTMVGPFYYFGVIALARKTKMNKLTSPELLAEVNPNNLELRDEFLNYLKAINRSEGTVKQYRNDLDIFFCWVLQNARNKDFNKVTKRDIVAFQGWLINDNGNSPARVRRIKATVSSLSNFCENILADEEEEYENFRSIVRKIENPALEPVREKTVLQDDDVENILAKLVDQKKYEQACYIALAAYGGRRKAEICRFRVDDFADDKLMCGGSLYRSAPIRTKGRGGGKIIPCYTLAKKFKPYYDLWMAERNAAGIESVWLFPASTDPEKQLQISTVNSWMESISTMTGLNIYAHSFRHYYTTMLSNQGLPDNVIKEIQGWGSISMVSVYLDRDIEDTLDMYFDENGVKEQQSKRLEDL